MARLTGTFTFSMAAFVAAGFLSGCATPAVGTRGAFSPYASPSSAAPVSKPGDPVGQPSNSDQASIYALITPVDGKGMQVAPSQAMAVMVPRLGAVEADPDLTQPPFELRAYRYSGIAHGSEGKADRILHYTIYETGTDKGPVQIDGSFAFARSKKDLNQSRSGIVRLNGKLYRVSLQVTMPGIPMAARNTELAGQVRFPDE